MNNWFGSISWPHRIWVELYVLNGFGHRNPAPTLPFLPVLHSLLGAVHRKEFNLCHCKVSEWSEKPKAHGWVRLQEEEEGGGVCKSLGPPYVWSCAQFPGEHPAWHLITLSLVRGFCDSSQRKVIDERNVWSELRRPAPNVHAYINIDWIWRAM